jgi:hypothetical protein
VRKKSEEKTIATVEIQAGGAVLHILGATPFIYNAMSAKAKQELLKPKGRKTAAEKASSLKHVPQREYRESVYRRRDADNGPTRLLIPARMFKAAIVEAAKDMPGATAAQLRRLLWVEGDMLDLYGVPQILASVVRNSDMNRTPDIRTRAIVPQWAATIQVRYVQPQLSLDTVGKLVGAAGILNGVGDWRQQKGSGNYGQFRVVGEDDPQFQSLVRNGGMAAQDEALTDPEYYDQETEELLAWFDGEVAKLDKATQASLLA